MNKQIVKSINDKAREYAAKRDKSPETVIEYIMSANTTREYKRECLAINCKRMLVNTIKAASTLITTYQNQLPTNYDDKLITAGAKMLDIIPARKITDGICEWTRDYWELIERRDLQHFINNYHAIADRVHDRMKAEGVDDDQYNVSNIIDKITPIVDIVNQDGVEEQDIDSMFRKLSAVVIYARKYSELSA